MDNISILIDLVDWSPLHLLIPVAILQRIWELRLARRNARHAHSNGAVEYGADHYGAIVALHTLWFIGMIVEIVVLTRSINPFAWALVVIWLLAQGLRYWAIRSLGPAWNTRILVIPGARAVISGPYRYLSHPNYVAVVVELFVLPAIYNAWITAISVSIINAFLLRIRIKTEERGLSEMLVGTKLSKRVLKGRNAGRE